ncbi:MAG: nicotinate (nicotinamide) nucleotide adenylyltransferase [Terriglobales bacterium]
MSGGRWQRVGVLGGTFDPVHAGHLAMARAAARRCKLERIYFVPAAQPWHRQRGPVAGYADRYAMLALALADHLRWLPLAVPDALHQPTYTIDQIRWIRQHGLGEQITFILGADSFLTLPSWHRWRALLASCDWLVLAREGVSWEEMRTLVPRELTAASVGSELHLRSGRRIHWLAEFAQPASATRARRRLARTATAPVPAAVARYARRAGLYQVHG